MAVESENGSGGEGSFFHKMHHVTAKGVEVDWRKSATDPSNPLLRED